MPTGRHSLFLLELCKLYSLAQDTETVEMFAYEQLLQFDNPLPTFLVCSFGLPPKIRFCAVSRVKEMGTALGTAWRIATK